MLIDTHAHIGKILKFNMTVEDLLYSMERYGVELGQHRDFENVGIDTVADRNIDQAILPGNRNRRL